MALIDKETIRKEIERQIHMLRNSIMSQGDYGQSCQIVAYENILALLDTLPEQPVEGLENFDSAFDKYMKEHWTHGTQLKDIARHFYELGCRRTAVMYDDIEYNRQRAEEEEITKGLEEEYKKWWESITGRINIEHCMEWYMHETARHFAEWGAEYANELAQADLALTWEDIRLICEIDEDMRCHSDWPLRGQEVYYEEVLRRFREMKDK